MLGCFAMTLLMLPLIIAGLNGDTDNLRLMFPCDNSVCYHFWRFSTGTRRLDVAITSNGRMMGSTGDNNQDIKCSEKLQRLTDDTVGLHYCKITENAFVPQNEAPEFKVAPGFGVSFQCTLVHFLTLRHCSLSERSSVHLTWVDQDGREVRDNSNYHISQRSQCDVTLTVTLQAPGSEAFRCRARVGKSPGDSWISAAMRVQVPVPKMKGKGRGNFNLDDVEPQGGSRYQVGVILAVAALAVVTALAAMFVVVRRRKAANLSLAACPTPVHNHVADDVVYADVVFPVGADRISFTQGQDTEYASVRYR
ncbi:uncharacterized protein ACBT44_000638 isoform 1-T1 [Syngnathus typhle]